ncbi:MAG: hypothetical protein GC178_05170 [Flavobacteriales bacterium]|nr:hypothetical protein [Flavobacteriales bacterium]
MYVNLRQTYIGMLLVAFSSCSPKQLNTNDGTAKTTNPLDLILGDKLLELGSGEIRENNFQDVLTLSKQNLSDSSSLYDVYTEDSVFYFVNQRKMYSAARLFSMVLKVEGQNVAKFRAVDDFKVADMSSDTKGVTVLFGNFGFYGEHWKTDNEVQLVRFDNNLNEVWRYTPISSRFPMEGLKIFSQDGYTSVWINLITGCHICVNTYEVKVDSLGKCISAIEVDRNNSDVTIRKSLVDEVFQLHDLE